LQEISSSNLTNTAFNVNYPTAGELGQFDNGVTYVYTDPTKVDDFRSGSISRDITEVTVDTSKPHGTSQQNPYVISTLADWDNFVKRMATGTAYGAGEYFVLANDLDFTGEAFHPVMVFNGNFHGLGFALRNIYCDTWQYWNASTANWANVAASTTYAFGTFCNTTAGAVITDLIVEDYQFLNIPITNKISTLGRQSIVGGIMGYSRGGASSILNCHTSGVINGQTATNYTLYTPCGGIVGLSMNGMTIYRCSVTLDMTFTRYAKDRCGMICGGIIANAYQGDAAYYTYIYDVVAETTINITATSNFIGNIVGISHSKTFKVENAVCKIETTSNIANSTAGIGWQNTDLGTSSRLHNIYSSCFHGQPGATKLPNYFSASSGYLTASNSQLSNLHIVKPSALPYASIGGAYHTTINNSSPLQPALHEVIDDIYAKVEADVDSGILPSKIWDKSKIGNYTPADSPVRNFLTANVTFSNLLSGGGEEGLGIATAEYRAGDALPSPSGSYLKPNHTFRGWTMDKTGKSDPINELPTGVFGDVT
ncbi:MAG: hypothetical protein HFE34_06285, partial [Clostridia bacterium]|nr:hypothetical protein [Clostridia bacterium]